MTEMKRLVEDAARLTPASSVAAAEYRDMRHAMVEFVNDRLRRRPDLEELIGRHNLSQMLDNHFNHMLFMCNVLDVGRYELLARVLPWVYRSYHQHGFSYDYFPVEVSAWREAIRTYLSPQSAAELLLIYDWMIAHHDMLVSVVESQRQAEAARLASVDEKVEKWVRPLILGNSRGVMALAAEHLQTAADLPTFYEDVITPVMGRIGLLWEYDRISVAQEHQASAIVTRVLAWIRSHIEFPEPWRGQVIVTAAPNEHHVIGSRVLSDLLELDGWQSAYLGADTPADDVVRLAVDLKPMVLAVSVAMPFCVQSAMAVLNKVRLSPQLSQTRTMVGGMAFDTIPELRQIIPADLVNGNAMSSIKIADQWWKEAH